MIDQQAISELIPWFVNIFYFLALLPQLALNYKLKSTSGLSDFYIFGYLNGYVMNLFYVYGLNLPYAYRFMAPLALLVVLILVYQRFHYDKKALNKKWVKLYSVDFSFMFLFPFIMIFPNKIGHFAGWIAAITWFVYQLPQVFKIYKTKSIVGFSFLLATLIGLGNVMELIFSVIFKLPLQTSIVALRGILVYVIFCAMFWLYEVRPKRIAKMEKIRLQAK